MYGIEGYRGLGLLIVAILTLQPQSAEGNIRCYSCAPCNEFEYFAGDLSAFETDCLADRSCLKISGVSRDLYGYEREVSVRGCPLISGLTRIEEGCTQSSFNVAGLGIIQGTVCFCQGHLCNEQDHLHGIGPLALMLMIFIVHAKWCISW